MRSPVRLPRVMWCITRSDECVGGCLASVTRGLRVGYCYRCGQIVIILRLVGIMFFPRMVPSI